MARTSITIVLELEEATDIPAGSARLPDGPTREFHGWLGLAEAIDALVRMHVSGDCAAPNGKETP